jgi:hypothetical protein
MIATTFTKKIAAPVVETWTRPTDWLSLPSVPAQGLVGLCAVPPEGGYVSILANTNLTAANGGRYIVNWGDGTQDEINANVRFNKILNYNNYSNLSSLGYRQAIITITPKSGQNLTSLQIREHVDRPNSATPWLDIEINATTSLTGLNIGLISAANVYHYMLQRVKIHSLGNVTSIASLFRECISLQEVILPSTTKITSMSTLFYNCFSLLSVPVMDTSNVTNMSSMFYGCYKLKSVPAMNTAKVTTFSAMFQGCISLLSAPFLDASKTTTMANLFNGCVKLENIQNNFSTTILCTSLAYMFSGCRFLKNSPTFSNTSKVTNIAGLFNGCTELLSAPMLDCSSVTNIYATFSGCSRLTSLPNYVFPIAITDARLFISFATNLKSIANLIFSSTIGNMGEFANGANSLRAVPALNVTPASNNLTSFNRCYNLADVPDNFILGCKTTTDFRHCSLSAADLNKIFTSLATVLTTQTNRTISIRGNPGTATCDKTIATNKNWIVDVTTA